MKLPAEPAFRALCISLTLSFSCLAAATGASAAGPPIIDVPVAFTVVNSNTSGVPCPSDGATYTLRGHLVGPRPALARPNAVTLYVHGFNSGEWNFRFPAPGYDTAAELAKRGHVSVAFDRLGFDASDFSEGYMTCFGAHADMLHQVVQQLRSGSYAAAEGAPVRFSTVVVAGHDLGGTIAEIEAYSYKDIDGLIVMNIDNANDGYRPPAPTFSEYSQAAGKCATGGQPSERDSRSAYARFISRDEDLLEYALANSEPAVTERFLPVVNTNPCGDLMSTVTALNTNSEHVDEIAVPVLLLHTELDFNRFYGPAAEAQKETYTGSDDVTLVQMEDTGHFPMLDRNAPRFRSIVSDWLTSRGF